MGKIIQFKDPKLSFGERLALISERLQRINELLDELKELQRGQSKSVRREAIQTKEGEQRDNSKVEEGAEENT